MYFTDGRGLFRPGETVRIKGWARQLDPKKTSQPNLSRTESLQWRAYDARNNEFASGEVSLNSLGGLDFQFDIPDDVNLGYARGHPGRLLLRTGGVGEIEPCETRLTASASKSFDGRNTKSASRTPAGPHFIGDTVTAEVQASYFSGGGLSEAPVRWNISTQTTHYAPPGWPAFSFGKQASWWDYHTEMTQGSHFTQQGETDGEGVHRLTPPFGKSHRAPTAPLHPQCSGSRCQCPGMASGVPA